MQAKPAAAAVFSEAPVTKGTVTEGKSFDEVGRTFFLTSKSSVCMTSASVASAAPELSSNDNVAWGRVGGFFWVAAQRRPAGAPGQGKPSTHD